MQQLQRPDGHAVPAIDQNKSSIEVAKENPLVKSDPGLSPWSHWTVSSVLTLVRAGDLAKQRHARRLPGNVKVHLGRRTQDVAWKRFTKARVTRRTTGHKNGASTATLAALPSTTQTTSAVAVEKCQERLIDHHHISLLDGLEVLWRQGALCDVTLLTEDVRLRAHRVVLATCSDYFHSVFCGTVAPSPDEQVPGTEYELTLEGISAATLETILECMYTGRVSVSDANVRELLVGASRLRFYAVELACGDFLRERLNKHNCLRMLNLAATYNLASLREESLREAAEHFGEVAQGYDFIELEVDQLINLVARDDITAESELDIFRRALSWLEYDKESRMRHAGELLQHVRFPLISPAALVDHVESVDYLEGVPECEALVKEALHYHCLPARQSLLQTERTCPRVQRKRECILAIGGAPRLKSDPVNRDISCFDPDTDQWEHLTRLKEPRHHHAVAVLGGFLYVAGGEETNDQRSPLNTAHRYDPRTDTWLQITSMRQARESFQLGVLNGRLYAVGGRVDQDISLAEVERYNPAIDRWENVSPISVARRSVALAAHNGRLYAMGGSGHKRISSKVERYNPLTNAWESRRPLSVPRFFALLQTVGNRLFLIGGATIDTHGNVVCVRKVECYVPVTDTWVTLAPMINPRAEAGCALLGNQIYVSGGYSWDNNKRLSSVEKYDVERDHWSGVTDLGTAYTGVGCCALMVYDLPQEVPATRQVSPATPDATPDNADELGAMTSLPATPASLPGMEVIVGVKAPNSEY